MSALPPITKHYQLHDQEEDDSPHWLDRIPGCPQPPSLQSLCKTGSQAKLFSWETKEAQELLGLTLPTEQ